MEHTILVADDEPEIRSVLKLYLENAGYRVIEAADGHSALETLQQESIDLCILDIMMPKKDGYQVLKEMRDDGRMIPVIILSAKDDDPDKILGLNLGADDYVVKPFNPLEVAARVASNLRRWQSAAGSGAAERLVCRDLALDTESCLLYRDGKPIELTSVEFKIMEMFLRHPGKVFTKQQIYECGWGDDYIIADNNIMVCISKLRSKLSDDPAAYIKTIRGLGYRLER